MIALASKAATKAGHALGLLEKWGIVLLLTFIAGFAILQIILRNFFSTGLVWGDDLLRHGVLWLTLLGAARASAENRHIRIDVLPRLLPARGRLGAALLGSLFSCLVCSLLCWASLSFVHSERLAADIAFAGIPYWWLETIFPFSFALMTVRFGLLFIKVVRRGPGGKQP